MLKPHRTTRTTRNSRSGWEQSSGVALRQSLSITPRPVVAIQIDSACLERSITDPILIISIAWLLTREIRAENSHLFCITANSHDVSRDLITRCVVINLHHEGDPTKRSFSMDDPEAYVQTIGCNYWVSCKHGRTLESQRHALAKTQTRFNKKGWGNIGGILEANGEPDFMANARMQPVKWMTLAASSKS